MQFFQCCAIFSRARIQSLKFLDAKQNNYFERPMFFINYLHIQNMHRRFLVAFVMATSHVIEAVTVVSVHHSPGVLTRKMYTPARTAPPPSVAQNLRNLTLTDTKFGPKSIPLLAKIHKKCTLCGTTIVKKWLIGTNVDRSAKNPANFAQFLTFCTLHSTTTGKTIPFLAHIWCSEPYP